MAAQAFHPSTQETEAGGSVRPGLHITFQFSQGYTENKTKKWDIAAIVKNTIMTICYLWKKLAC